MKQRFLIIVLVITAVLVFGPFLIPLPKQPDLAPEEIAREDALEGGRFISVDGFQTFIKDVGPRDGEAVVMIHGFGGSTFSWRETTPALANRGYRAIAIDLKGFGLSDKVFREDYSHPAQAEFVAALLDQLAVEQAVMMGHSMGANVMAHFAFLYPARVTKLIIVDGAIATGDDPQTGLDGGGWLVNVPQIRRIARIAARSILSEEEIIGMLESAVYEPAFVTPELVNGYYTPLTIKDWEQALLGIMRDRDKNVIPQPLNELTTPTLIIWGENDTWVSPENGPRLLDELPNAELATIPESGHLPMEERPDFFNSLLLTFLEKGTVQSGG